MSAAGDVRACVVGAGAVGGMVGARLSASGVPTSALARGATLESLQRNGWRLRTADGDVTGLPTAPRIDDRGRGTVLRSNRGT